MLGFVSWEPPLVCKYSRANHKKARYCWLYEKPQVTRRQYPQYIPRTRKYVGCSCCTSNDTKQQHKLEQKNNNVILLDEKVNCITVVLFQPKIPGNTGNIGRTCLAFGARLHLVGPLGFSISEHAVRRAGLDYWKHVDLEYSSSWEEFEKCLTENSYIYFITTQGTVSLESVSFEKRGSIFLVFGSETEGFQQLPKKAFDRGLSVYIPMLNKHIIRSHNLSNAVAMVLWEWRRCP